jgi:hypothetical protein
MTATPKKLGVALLSVLFSFSLLTPVFADQRPYFKSFGSDVMSGGWYANGATCPTALSSYYQDNMTSGGSADSGGIQAYAKSSGANANGGSSSQFAAFALGVIEGNAGASYGFYSGGINPGDKYNNLTFADDPGWGGRFQGTARQSHCIPDYYGKKPVASPVIGTLTSGTASNAYSANGAGAPFALTGTGGGAPVTIGAGKAITIYVDGNAYIDRNIVYQLTTATEVPKFALVARGSIYIDPAVSRLDGLYIAQINPADLNPVNNDTGVIWTCHPNNTDPVLYTYPTVNCRSKLTLRNAAFIAKQINLLRVNGDVASATTAEDAFGTAEGSGNIAELINYSPAMVLGGPFFNPTTAVSNQLKTDSIISLPPVF